MIGGAYQWWPCSTGHEQPGQAAQPGAAARVRGRRGASALPRRGGRDRHEPARPVRGGLGAGGGARRAAPGAYDAQGAALARGRAARGAGQGGARRGGRADGGGRGGTGPVHRGAPARGDPDRRALSAARRAAARPRALPRARPPGPRGADLLAARRARGRAARPAAARRAARRARGQRTPLVRRGLRAGRPRATTGSAAAATSRARRCGNCSCCSSTRGTACATRRSTSAGRPGAPRGRR